MPDLDVWQAKQRLREPMLVVLGLLGPWYENWEMQKPSQYPHTLSVTLGTPNYSEVIGAQEARYRKSRWPLKAVV